MANKIVNQSDLNSLIWRAIHQFPINAAYRASVAQRAVMFADPRNNPARMQFSEGYTAPYQRYASSNTWQTPSASNAVGQPARQPSIKYAGPQNGVSIPTRMPWE